MKAAKETRATRGGRADAEVVQRVGKGERAAQATAEPTLPADPDLAMAGLGTGATPESPALPALRTLAVVAPEE